MTESAADVLIVGGGLMGAATAFFLRRRGRSVILLERDLVGQHASGTNFGNVRRQGRFLPQLPLANRARELWGRLPELIERMSSSCRPGTSGWPARPKRSSAWRPMPAPAVPTVSISS